ncbi:MAG: adenylate/guanylate cyclase domain-containing protein [Solirubrobacterales bacterium]
MPGTRGENPGCGDYAAVLMMGSISAAGRSQDWRTLFTSLYRRALVANAVGATLAFVYLSFVAPPKPAPPDHERFLVLGVAPLFFLAVGVIGYLVGRRGFRPAGLWLTEKRPPTGVETRFVLGLPWRAAALVATGWLAGAILFGVITATHHPAIYVAGLVVGVLLAGLTTMAVTFLTIERALRPVFALALAGEAPAEQASASPAVLGTGARLLVSWALGSGIALLAIALAFLGRGEATGDELLGPVLFLVAAGLFAGGVLITAAARSLSEPVDRVRAAIARVEEGSFEEEVVVDDGGEIGFLQAGFNRMVAGLRERERIREAFGTYVDREVADHILREGTSLAGEEVEVTMLFLDIRGFTSYAESLRAPEVVATLNRLFERIVPIVHRHGGHVDKYVGDGLLAVFGAPRRQADHADQALAAALEIAAAVEDEFGQELSVGIGLNSGPVVSGNLGGAGRLEFSVIGDAVNVAARVESATRQTGDRVLVAARTRELLEGEEIAFVERPGLTLKGKAKPVAIYAPVPDYGSPFVVGPPTPNRPAGPPLRRPA